MNENQEERKRKWDYCKLKKFKIWIYQTWSSRLSRVESTEWSNADCAVTYDCKGFDRIQIVII